MKHKFIYIISIFFFIINLLTAQFSDVSITIDTRQLRGHENPLLFNTLKESMTNYLIMTEFAQDALDLDLFLSLHFTISSISENTGVRQITSQVFASNDYDQKYFLKNIDFQYSQGQSIYFNQTFEPLASFLDFTAYLFIAGELDTYDPLGGNIYYLKAEGIAVQGKSSKAATGWGDRLKKCQNIQDNLSLRNAKLHFYSAYDLISTNEFNQDEFKKEIDSFYNHIRDIEYSLGLEKNTLIFLKSHAEEISVMFIKADMSSALIWLSRYDDENIDIYNKYLINSNQ